MTDIFERESFRTIRPVKKGWSGDRKYYIETHDGSRLLLRVADISEYERKKAEYEAMERVAALGVPMSRPVEFGVCEDGTSVYSLLTWCDGEDAETALPPLSESEQYALGVKSGEILRLMHSIPAPETQEEWSVRFSRKTDIKINKYRECGICFDSDDKVIGYIEQNRVLLENRPQYWQHGDYHVGNMIISDGGALSVIDFNRPDFGDPWEEFNRIVWSAAVSPYFATGQINGYFGGRPPLDFFRLLAFYISSNTLSSIYWAIPFGQGEVDTMMKQSQDVLRWFGGMTNPVPDWYLGELCLQYIDDIPYRLKAPYDMSFIGRYGRVFKVFDDQDSGNICFGLQSGEERFFIKYAGAPAVRYDGRAEDAVGRLRAAEPVYRELEHPNLVRLIGAGETSGGYALIFEWADGECMGRMYPRSRQKFMRMPTDKKLQVFGDVLAFHEHAAKRGYTAVDFYDGSIMYDSAARKTTLCDIDFYRKQPSTNDMGRMWGSSRFMSPEEFILGAEIDEITNVYAMGATAFALFSEYDRSEEAWPLGAETYAVAKKAVSDDRSMRQQTIAQFAAEWKRAAACMTGKA